MNTVVNQSVKVYALFDSGRLIPSKFVFNHTEIKIQKIVFHHTCRLGQTILHHFSVEANQMLYHLQFNHQTLVWKLMDIYENRFES